MTDRGLRRVDAPHADGTFLRVPWRVHRDHPHWVPPLLHSVKRLLRPTKNPLWREARCAGWTAHAGGEAVGRILAILNPVHDRTWDERAGFFGFFECIDDASVARDLVDAATAWLRAEGATVVRGPVSPTTNDECGVLIDGFDRDPFLMMPWTPPYYPGLLEGCGFEKSMDLHAYGFSASIVFPERVGRIADRVRDRLGIRIRPIDLGRFDEELERLREVYNGAWADNWGFVPMTAEAFRFASAELRPFAVADFIPIAEIDGEPVASAIAAPDLNPLLKRMNGRILPFGFRHIVGWRKKVDAFRLLTLGVLPKWQGRGIDALLYRHMLEQGKKHRLTRPCELGWVLESNHAMVSTIENIGGERTKTMRLYAKPIA